MFEEIEYRNEKSELVDKSRRLNPLFKNSSEAINYYSQELAKLSSAQGKSVDEFLALAETDAKYNHSLIEALSLARKIRSLKSIS